MRAVEQPDVQDMIWEVDEDCDQCVSWQEFQSMYRRCRNDTTGYEPRRLFNVVEFVMNDKDDSGTVSVEEAMSVLYLRYGKGVLDEVRCHGVPAALPSSTPAVFVEPGTRTGRGAMVGTQPKRYGSGFR
jgi:hypothetical protein